jgi:hypothetical protein
MGFAALGLPRHRIPRAGMGQALNHSIIQKINNIRVFFGLQGVIKMVKRGCRGSPPTPYQRDAALQGHEMRP